MYLKLGTLGHLISAEFSQSKNVRIIFWEKATVVVKELSHPKEWDLLILFPASWDISW